jgi:hypothetical protein
MGNQLIDLIVAGAIFIIGKQYIDSGALDGILGSLGGKLSLGGGAPAIPAGGAADDSGGDAGGGPDAGGDAAPGDAAGGSSKGGKSKGGGKKSKGGGGKSGGKSSKGGGGSGSKSKGGSSKSSDTSTPDTMADTGGSTDSAGTCDCTCMPMASDKTRFKIETAAGVDCYNHVYPASMAECQTALQGVCAKRGGTSSNPSSDANTPAPADTSAKGGAKKTTKKKKSNAAFVYMPEQIDPNMINILATYKNTHTGKIKDSAYTWNVSNYI